MCKPTLDSHRSGFAQSKRVGTGTRQEKQTPLEPGHVSVHRTLHPERTLES